MMKMHWVKSMVGLLGCIVCSAVIAAADLQVNTPGITALQGAMQARHADLEPFYNLGAVGFTRDGLIVVRDAQAAPLAKRQSMQGLVAAENKDRQALYQEIANANGHPEWAGEVKSTFAQKWIQKLSVGWWYQDANGAWVKK